MLSPTKTVKINTDFCHWSWNKRIEIVLKSGHEIVKKLTEQLRKVLIYCLLDNDIIYFNDSLVKHRTNYSYTYLSLSQHYCYTHDLSKPC